jgi:hypothetical protein
VSLRFDVFDVFDDDVFDDDDADDFFFRSELEPDFLSCDFFEPVPVSFPGLDPLPLSSWL